MSVIDGPYGVALQVLLTLLVIELGWGIAVLVAWLFGSIVAFYAVGSAATVSFIIASLFLLLRGGNNAGKGGAS
jgi:hypothetical protein